VIPKVSFVVSAFNRPVELKLCLLSLALQTDPNWEIIVVDNSDDDHKATRNSLTYSGINRYIRTTNDTRISGAPHEHSLYRATEMGVAAAKGKWLCFPNDDSYYCPWFLERMLGAAKANSWELVYCDLVAGGPKEHHWMRTEPRRCQIDKTCFLVKRGWFRGFDHRPEVYAQADGLLIEDLVARGIRHGRVGQCLVVHN
jgi:GT2 family glycosyltransferase